MLSNTDRNDFSMSYSKQIKTVKTSPPGPQQTDPIGPPGPQQTDLISSAKPQHIDAILPPVCQSIYSRREVQEMIREMRS